MHSRNLLIWIVVALALGVLFSLVQGRQDPPGGQKITYSQLLDAAEAGAVREVVISGREITGQGEDGRRFETYAPDDPNLVARLREKGVVITAKPEEKKGPSLLGIFLSWLPMLLLIGVWIYFMRQMQSGSGRAMGFGRSRMKFLNERQDKVTFEDVAGIDEAKQDLQEIVDFLRSPMKFQRLGGRIPKGVLLVGPPGTGKTLLARAIAGEAHVPFFTISGSDFVEMFVGVGASRVRDMFAQAKRRSPCIVFIDEIDAVGRHRGAGLGGGNDEREQTLNQLLVEMDGFEVNQGVIIVAATNRPDVLDPALLRPGRFDRQVVVPNPDLVGREKILKIHMRKVKVGKDVDVRVLARGTPGFSGADLANLVNEAALLAVRRSRQSVWMSEFEDAKDKVMMGAERRSMVMTEEDRRLTAYHEGGHALVALHMPASDPIHKATIIPRGRALGMVMRLPERDPLSVTREKLNADLTVAMGGRVAEELVFGYEKVTSGAASDIKMATQMARSMVTRFGMSDKLGPLSYHENEEEIFLGHSVARQQNLSEETQRVVDQEVRVLVEGAYQRSQEILRKHLKDLHIIAKGLMEYETLSGDEIKKLLRGEDLGKENTDDAVHEDETPETSVPVVGDGLEPDPA